MSPQSRRSGRPPRRPAAWGSGTRPERVRSLKSRAGVIAVGAAPCMLPTAKGWVRCVGAEVSTVVRSGPSMHRWVWLVAALLAILLPMLTAVDVDGDPTTANLPDAVLVESARPHDVGERDVDDVVGEESLTRRAGRGSCSM